jgi:ubiquinone/menaquinone biosynthesis C-methylase UbiE
MMTDTYAPALDILAKMDNAIYPSLATLAGIQLQLFQGLLPGPLAASELATAMSLDVSKLTPLLYALVRAGLLTLRDDRFANTAEAAYYLNPTSPHYVGSYYEGFWLATLKTADSVRTGRPSAQPQSAEDLSRYFATIGSGRDGGAEIIELFDINQHTTLLDVGGGLGGSAILLAESYPHLRVTIVDLPRVLPLTRQYLAEHDTSGRVDCIEADVVHGLLKGRFDAAVVSRFLHVLSPEEARQALGNIAQVINPGGTIYITSTLILDETRTSPDVAVYLSLALINLDQGGQAHTEIEYRTWLTEAGFVDVVRVNETTMTARKG